MKTILNVEGMSCSHCENTIKNFLLAMEGVSHVSVSLSDKTVSVEHQETVGVVNLKEAIVDLGFDVI